MTQDDWRPVANWDVLRLRAELLQRVRRFFCERDFLEVETPLLSADVVVDRRLEPFAVAGQDGVRWLQTSPEFAMKRLLAAGGTALFQITKAFRQEERGPRHNPEFTVVEWYRRGDDLLAGMQLLSDFAEALLGRGAAGRLSYEEAFQRYAAVDPHAAGWSQLQSAAERAGVCIPQGMPAERDAWLDLLLVERIESELGKTTPVILYDYPASQAAMARVRSGDPPVAERFELYVDGIELANGYHELLDPDVLAERNTENNLYRAANGKQPLPEASRLLDAMRAGLPAAAGVALGFDRLVMVAAGAGRLDDVLPFPWERA